MNFDNFLTFQENVFHCGELNPELRKPYSLEGNLLSTSPCPDVWKQINRIQSNKVIKLEADYFIDVIKVKESEDIISFITQYALDNDLAKQEKYYSVSYFDDELEQEMETLIKDYDQAKEEAECYESDLSVKIVLEPTSKLENFFQQDGIPNCLSVDFIIMYYSINELNQYKFFWNEELDILGYSAPRGGVFNFNLNEDKYETMTINEYLNNFSYDLE